MNEVQGGIWDKLTRVVIFLIVLAGLLLLITWYLPGTQQKQRMLKDIQRRDAQIQSEEAAGKDLKTSIDSLRESPQAVERLARDKFGYAKPGETVVRFSPPPTNAPAAQ